MENVFLYLVITTFKKFIKIGPEVIFYGYLIDILKVINIIPYLKDLKVFQFIKSFIFHLRHISNVK